jgi:hypothetical protein
MLKPSKGAGLTGLEQQHHHQQQGHGHGHANRNCLVPQEIYDHIAEGGEQQPQALCSQLVPQQRKMLAAAAAQNSCCMF